MAAECSGDALVLLSRLEREEARLLAWGAVDGAFTRAEVIALAEDVVAHSLTASSLDNQPGNLLNELKEAGLLLYIRRGTHGLYRTRMAETVRLMSRLRQIFPKAQTRFDWASSPTLVADFRFMLRQRSYPRRDVAPSAAVGQIAEDAALTPLQQTILDRLTAAPARRAGLSGFQSRSATRILSALQRGRHEGVMVSAGTGTGKTLAFYLPAFAAIAELIDHSYWPKVIGIYPRTELLRDQAVQALREAHRIRDILTGDGRRPVLFGVLYGSTPHSAGSVGRVWKQVGQGFECPYVRCPNCQLPMIWRQVDVSAARERLYCSKPTCPGVYTDQDVVLTRDRMEQTPPDLLLVTTEMINRNLGNVPFGRVIGTRGHTDMRPRLVLLDEVHTYTGMSGAQNALLIRRWRHLVRRPMVFVGLSATLRDARQFLSEVTGLNEGDIVSIEPSKDELIVEGMEYAIALRGDATSGATLLATTIQTAMLMRRMLDPATSAATVAGQRLFAFTDDLDVTNRLYWNLLDAEGWDAFGEHPIELTNTRWVHSLAELRSPTLPDHGARVDAGQSWDACVTLGHDLGPTGQLRIARTSSQDPGYDQRTDVVVATASLDVGMDDPRVGAVLQHKAPRDEAQFIQRRGRAGRLRGMRPWTVVVLSDFGRDRIAYDEHDRLFDPELPSRSLPVGNRYVLRMQAAFSTMDWLALTIGGAVNVWDDLAGPLQALTASWARQRRHRQELVARLIEETLSKPSRLEELRAHLRAALRITDEEVDAVLWEPPRALLTAVLPTMHRRLATGWRRVDGVSSPDGVAKWPLPEFVPSNLFSDLLLPEVEIIVPAATTRTDERRFPLAVVQAIEEFTPGRASRRYALAHGHQRHWAPLPEYGVPAELSLPVTAYCSSEPSGMVTLWETDGPREFVGVRPWAIATQPLPKDVRDTTSARAVWRSNIRPAIVDDAGIPQEVPTPSPWADVVCDLTIFSQQFGSGLHVSRFSIGSDATVLPRRGDGRRVRVRYVDRDGPDGQPAAVGVTIDVDGLRVRHLHPKSLPFDPALPGALGRSFRTGLFRHLVLSDQSLNSVSNEFQLDALHEIALIVVAGTVLGRGRTVEQVVESWHVDEFAQQLEGEVRSRWVTDADPSDQPSTPDADDDIPRRLRQLVELCQREKVVEQILAHLRVLWSAPNVSWYSWHRDRYAATIGAAILSACYRLCPDIGQDDLCLDILTAHPEVATCWITETVPGGGGVIQRILQRYAEDPRRFFHLVDAALTPPEPELVGRSLERALQLTAQDESVASALDRARSAWLKGHEEAVGAIEQLLAALDRRGVTPSHALVAALNARILRPGASRGTDDAMRQLFAQWHAAEERLGFELDLRVFSACAALDPANDAFLSQVPGAHPTDDGWRTSMITGLLWPRGGTIRQRSLDASHRFQRFAATDWELVRLSLRPTAPLISLASDDWVGALDSALVLHGAAILQAPVAEHRSLRRAALSVVGRAVDTGGLLLYPRISATTRDEEYLCVTFELREAVQ